VYFEANLEGEEYACFEALLKQPSQSIASCFGCTSRDAGQLPRWHFFTISELANGLSFPDYADTCDELDLMTKTSTSNLCSTLLFERPRAAIKTLLGTMKACWEP
jgi:hypothetical protein